MKQAKESIATMIKAASSRAILLIFSSFLPARAVGVVGDTAFSITLVDNVSVAVVVGCCDGIVYIESIILINIFFPTPRQRNGAQGKEG